MANKAPVIQAHRSIATHDLQHTILEALAGLKFGAVEIQVHDSRIVRIIRTEKVRLDYPVDVSIERD
jgi:hypothetical protein